MSLENNQQVKSEENQQANREVDNSRRSFAKRSAAMVPVVFTMANRSAWGAGSEFCAVNQSLIGIQSYQVKANMSHYAYPVANTSWKDPTNWKLAIQTVSGNSVTYADLINVLSREDLTAYQTASQLNNKYYFPFPSALLTTEAILSDYTTFYICAGGDSVTLPSDFKGL